MRSECVQTTLSKIAAKLKRYEGKKITIVKFSEFGFPMSIQCRLSNAEVTKHDKNKEKLEIVYRPKMLMNNSKSYIYLNSDLIIYEGWANVKLDRIYTIDPKTMKTVVLSDYKAFDKRHLQEILYTVKSNIIIQMIDGKLYVS